MMSKVNVRVTFTLDFDPTDEQRVLMATMFKKELDVLKQVGVLFPNQGSWRLLDVEVFAMS